MQLGITVMELRLIIWGIADEHVRRLIFPDGVVRTRLACCSFDAQAAGGARQKHTPP